MNSISFSIDKTMVKKLKRAIETKSKEVFDAMMKGAELSGMVIEAEAKKRFIKGGGSKQAPHPTRPTSRSGEAGIYGKIATSIKKKGKDEVIYQVRPNGGSTFANDIIYARRLEFGFYGTDSIGRTFAQPPRSYMRAGFESGKQKAFSVFKQELSKVL
jgi:hypothetical protein